MRRRSLLAGLAALLTSGCSKLAHKEPLATLLTGAEEWNRNLHNLLGRRTALAREYSRADISPFFRGNGSVDVPTAHYRDHVANHFTDWRLAVTGLVKYPLSLSLREIAELPQRTQITRHDCVEGWSAIGEWSGPQLSYLLDRAGLEPEARYIVFQCADRLNDTPYYESIDLIDAYHPQTIIAHRLNGAPLPIRNGAPLRVRIERQLGYKHAKFLTAIEAVATLDGIGRGKGGYWEDREGYQWYAGI